MEDKQTKYQELIDYINKLISDEVLKPGEKLYSENELARMFDISRQTVRKAIGVLEQEGVLRRIRGSGTYISRQRPESDTGRNRIAVVTTYMDSYIFPKIIQGIYKVLFERGYSVQIAFTNNTLEREKNVLADIINRDDVAGMIVEGTKSGLPNPNIGQYRQILDARIPLLFINTYYPEIAAPHVSLNDSEAARKAVQFLISKGHRDIGAILKLDDGQGRLRYLGYMKALEEAGIEFSDSRIVWIDTDEARQLSFCMDKIQARTEQCTALLCYNDQVAFQLIRLLGERGVKVPGDVSVISIDDSELALHSEPTITSLPHPKEELGARAAESLLNMIHGCCQGITYEFDTRVVERASTAEFYDGNNNQTHNASNERSI